MNYLEGMQYKIKTAAEENWHFHPELEFIFVIEGQIRLEMQGRNDLLKKHDVVLINAGTQHAIRVQEKAIVCVVNYSWQLLSTMLGGEESVFACNSAADRKRSYLKLQAIFQQLVYHAVSRKHKTNCIEQSLLYRLLDELVEYYLQGTRLHDSQEDLRLHKILRYVGANFQSNISLSALADEMFVSTSTLSRFFRKKTGIYFADYVNQVRLDYAAQELGRTDKNVTQIAVDSGFSNLSAFNRVFREMYGMTPSDYRKQSKESLKEQNTEETALKEQLKDQLEFEILENTQRPAAAVVQVQADVSRGEPYSKLWNLTMNAGSCNTLLLSNMQQHVLYLAEHLGFRYVRMWNVFSVPMMITDGKHMGGYQYDRLDIVLDFLVEHHLIPFLDMGVRPNAAAKAEGKAVFFESESVQFTSRAAWEAMVANFIQHVVKRYGVDVVSEWIFELAYDTVHIPESNCYQDDAYDNGATFCYLYRQLKAVSQNIQVGGPGAIIGWRDANTRDFLQRAKENGCIPDFASAFLFPYETAIEDGSIMRRRVTNVDNEREQIVYFREMVAQSGLDCKIYISEWNNSLSNRDYLNDSCFRAAYLTEKIEQLWGEVDMLGLWMASDWVSNYYDTGSRIANGGSGLLTKDLIHKPVYYALKFLSSMGDSLIDKGKGYLMTRREQQDYYILCYNFKWYDCSYFVSREDIDDPAVIPTLFQDSDPLTFKFQLQDLPFDRCVVKKRLVSPKEGMILTEWSKFQYALTLDAPDVQYIRQACFPRMSMERMQAQGHTLSFETVLQPHEVMLIHIYRDFD